MDETASASPLPPGTRLRDLIIQQTLGRGGMGIVYVAEHDILRERFALKEFLPDRIAVRGPDGRIRALPGNETLFEQVRAKFLDEGQTLMRLAQPHPHPNLVQVTDAFRANDTVYLCMRLEQGQPLDRILAGAPAPDETTLLGWIRPLLDGLEHAHAQRVWHRDIKPSNILIRNDGSPVLIDFGAARQDRTESQVSVIRQFTPEFAAPEQLYGGPQGPWTDIYALAATGFYAVTGQIPPRWALPPDWRAEHPCYSDALLLALEAGLQLAADQRPPSIAHWRRLFDRIPTPEAAAAAATLVETVPLTAVAPALFPESTAHPAPTRWHRPAAALGVIGSAVLLAAAFWILVAQDRRDTAVMAPEPVSTSTFTSTAPEPDCPAALAPFCGLLDRLTAPRAPGMTAVSPPAIRFNHADRQYREDDLLTLEITGRQPSDGYLYVDFVDGAGQVAHLLPTAATPDHGIAAGARRVIGAADAADCQARPADCFMISPPHGNNLILALWTARPVFPGPRLPQTEPVSGYLDALAAGLSASGADYAIGYQVFTTQP